MPYITSTAANHKPVKIYYEDWGTGKPVILIHGWPVDHSMWEYQMTHLASMGLRCIAYDRRGFGKSDKPWDGYDYSTMAEDLRELIKELDLQDVTLVGFSMAGGEIIRYCHNYCSARIAKIILVSSIIPYMMKTDTNPRGVPAEAFDKMEEQLTNDRPAFLADFGRTFFGVNWINHPVSHDILLWMQNLALQASPKATLACMHSFSQTDFRAELASIQVPTLVIHGDMDHTVPIEATGEQAAAAIKGAIYKIYPGAPHGLFITEKEMLASDIRQFAETGTVAEIIMEPLPFTPQENLYL